MSQTKTRPGLRRQPMPATTNTPPNAYPSHSLLKRFRAKLGLCFWCNHRARVTLESSAFTCTDAYVTSNIYRCCNAHAARARRPRGGLVYRGAMQLTSGEVIIWDPPVPV